VSVATDPVDALHAECELASQTVLGLPEEVFARRTMLPDWNLKELLGHMYLAIDRINQGLDAPEPAEADADSVSYWRSYDPVTDAPETAEAACRLALSFDSGQSLASGWDEMWRRTLGRAADTPRGRIVVTWGPALYLEDFLQTRALEITVHRMDLNAALDLPPDPTEGGLEVTEEILLGLLDAPGGGVGVSGVALVEIGTGRRDPTDDERRILGELDRFPLLA
jgi:uncharacterized protein (TIGR03083 family)